jgi:hypothetical protein
MKQHKEFADYSTEEKWDSINTRMRNIEQAETAYSLRRRVNPHHSIEHVRAEAKAFRADQYAKWCEIKDLYAEFRDELANTCSRPAYITCRDILERIFTVELDDALRETLG